MNIKLNYREIGNRLVELRTRKNVTQGDISKSLSIRQPSLSAYEQGKSKIPLEVILKYALFFHETLDYLILGIKQSNLSMNPAKYYKLYLNPAA